MKYRLSVKITALVGALLSANVALSAVTYVRFMKRAYPKGKPKGLAYARYKTVFKTDDYLNLKPVDSEDVEYSPIRPSNGFWSSTTPKSLEGEKAVNLPNSASDDVWSLFKSGSIDQAAVREMVKDGSADITLRDKAESTLLMFAASRKLPELTEDLIKAGADVNDKDYFGTTALMAAANSGDLKSLQLLIDAGADLNAKGSQGRTSLFFAAHQGHADITKALVDAGADVNIKSDEYGSTALIVARQWEHDEVERILLNAGADPDAKLEQGTSFVQ